MIDHGLQINLNSIDKNHMPLTKTIAKSYLQRSLSSLNTNKLNGLLAEIDFRNYLKSLRLFDRISLGGWIARRVGDGEFGKRTIALFPEPCDSLDAIRTGKSLTQPTIGLHTICATFHQMGIKSYFCSLAVPDSSEPATYNWNAMQLGTPINNPWQTLQQAAEQSLTARTRAYNFLKYNTNTSAIPTTCLAEELLKEHLRVSLQTLFMCEVSDIDGIFWGEEKTYPLEIKEKTAGFDKKLGEYFGIDIGPFTKLAFYASRRANLHSLFIAREIDEVNARNLRNWWAITFEKLAQYASWVPRSGGSSMTGGRSSVVMIPKRDFSLLDRSYLESLLPAYSTESDYRKTPR